MGLLQRAGVLKAIVSSHCLSNFRDLYNLRHLVRRWCTTTHTFFSCGKLTVTFEDVANQLLLPILGDADPATLEFSLEEEAIEAELRKRMAENAKLSYWVSSSSKFSVATRHTAFVAFWLCKFVFWVPPSLCHNALILSFSQQNICWGEPVVGPHVLGVSICPIRHPAEWRESGGILSYSYLFHPLYYSAAIVIWALCPIFDKV